MHRLFDLLSTRLQWLVALLSFTAVVITMWLPCGINIADFSDTWAFFSEIERGMPWVLTQDSRPFHVLSYQIAHLLTPDSFVGANLLIMALMVGKAFAFYLILKTLSPEFSLIAFFGGVLFVIFPSDTGLFWVSAMNIHMPVFFYLVSVILFLHYWKRPRLLLLIPLLITQTLSFTYEANYPLIFLTPLLLLLLGGGFTRRTFLFSLLWYVIPVTMAARLLMLYSQGAGFGYQQSLLGGGIGKSDSISGMIRSMVRIYQRHVMYAWTDAALAFRTDLRLNYLVLSGIAAVILFIGAAFQTTLGIVSWKRSGILLGMGLSIIGLGFLAYLPTEYRDIDYRTYFVSSAGGALVAVTIVYVISQATRRAKQILFILCICALFALMGRLAVLVAVILGTGLLILPRRSFLMLALAGLAFIALYWQLQRHERYAAIADRQQWILAAMAQQAPELASNTLIVLVDETDELDGLEAFEWRRDALVASLRVLYQQPGLDAAFCAPTEEVWGFFHEHCQFRPDGFWAAWDRGESVHPYNQIVVYRYDSEMGAELLLELPRSYFISPTENVDYTPQNLIVGSDLPARLYTMFAGFPFTEPPPKITVGELR
jgi:hypothetical protein